MNPSILLITQPGGSKQLHNELNFCDVKHKEDKALFIKNKYFMSIPKC